MYHVVAYDCLIVSPIIQSLSMDRLRNEDNYISDIDIAHEVALSAKLERSIAAASRRVELIVEEIGEPGAGDHVKRSDFTNRIMGVYAIYPEVFAKLFARRVDSDVSQGMSYDDLGEATRVIYNNRGLPLYNIVGADEDPSADRLDYRADTTEAATEALLVHPPSQDFLKDNNLGQSTYLGSLSKGYEQRITVKEIVKLIASAEYFENQHKYVSSLHGHWVDAYTTHDDNPQISNNRLQLIINALDAVPAYMPASKLDIRDEFKSQVNVAKNSEGTTIGALWELYMGGAAEALNLLEQEAARNRELFQAIVSGDANAYRTSDGNQVDE